MRAEADRTHLTPLMHPLRFPDKSYIDVKLGNSSMAKKIRPSAKILGEFSQTTLSTGMHLEHFLGFVPFVLPPTPPLPSQNRTDSTPRKERNSFVVLGPFVSNDLPPGQAGIIF